MDNKAIYLQIADTIIERILEGSLESGSRLPSVRECAATMEVNANTVMRAYDYLSSLDIISNRRGIGFFVTDDAREIVRRKCTDELTRSQLVDVFKRLALLRISPEILKSSYENFLSKQK